ncbi:MAG: hypothetical protein KJ621_15290 [Proteobacteria bacterium]|nr:hypothetical protein [Pseudomonadota bacterium]MBU1740844.1 hypothetical protein [Pseudomonadota bacterium]
MAAEVSRPAEAAAGAATRDSGGADEQSAQADTMAFRTNERAVQEAVQNGALGLKRPGRTGN